MHPDKTISFVIFYMCTDLDGVKLVTFTVVHYCLTTTSTVIMAIMWTSSCTVILLNDVIMSLIAYQ